MGVDSSALGNHGPAHRIEHDGCVFEIRLIDQGAKAEWEKRLYERAVRSATVMGPMKSPGWLENKLVQLDDEFLAGEFAFFTEKSLKLLQTPGGMELLLSILTGRDIFDFAPLIIAKEKEIKALLLLVIKQSFPGVKFSPAEGEADPNA